jgi:hypothetical protein
MNSELLTWIGAPSGPSWTLPVREKAYTREGEAIAAAYLFGVACKARLNAEAAWCS